MFISEGFFLNCLIWPGRTHSIFFQSFFVSYYASVYQFGHKQWFQHFALHIYFLYLVTVSCTFFLSLFRASIFSYRSFIWQRMVASTCSLSKSLDSNFCASVIRPCSWLASLSTNFEFVEYVSGSRLPHLPCYSRLCFHVPLS